MSQLPRHSFVNKMTILFYVFGPFMKELIARYVKLPHDCYST